MSNPVGAQRYGLGGGDAYYDAVKYGGYTGTREQFGRDQAEFAQNATAVAEAREEVDRNTQTVVDTAQTFTEETVPAAIQSVEEKSDTEEDRLELRTTELVEAVNAAGAVQVQAVRDEGTTQTGLVSGAGTAQVEAVEQAGSDQVYAVELAGSTQVGNVNNAGTTQVGNVNQAGTTQVGNVNTAGANQVQAVENKGEEVLNSIPADYSDLTEEVDNLNRHLSETQDSLQMITPTMRNGSQGNPANANGISTTYVLPTNGAKRVRVTMTIPKADESNLWEWIPGLYSQAGGLSSAATYRILNLDPYLYTNENFFVLDVDGYAGFAISVFERSNNGVLVQHRIAADGNCLKIEYEYDDTELITIPGVVNGSLGNQNNQNVVRTQPVIKLPENFAYIRVDIKNNTGEDLDFFYSIWAYDRIDIVSQQYQNRVAYLEDQQIDGNSFYIPASFFPPTAKSYALHIYAKLNGTTYSLRAINVNDLIRITYINIPNSIVEDAYTRNRDKDDMLAAVVRYNKTANNSKDFCILEITDSHSDIIAETNSITIANGFQYIDTLIHCGDFCADKAANFNKTVYDQFIACKKPFYFVCGNHDVGNGKTIADCIDNATVYTRYIQPLVDAGLLAVGEYQAGKSYYYHDFTAYKIRLICVYEYDDPNDIDQNDTTQYRILRGQSVISQVQAEWFCDTLISTPSGYSVVVAMHNSFSDIAASDTTAKFTESSVTGSQWAQRLFSTDFWADAVNAYVTRSSYTCNMVCTGDAAYLNGSGGYWYSFTKDFSSAAGSFLCFIGGHGHRDEIFVHPTYTYQKQVTPVCANTINYMQARSSDIRRTVNDSPSKDSLTAIGCDTANKKIRLTKIGVNVTENMTYRDIETINVS